MPIAAAALGAVVIEKHITLDRSMEGNDHKVSLLPDEFAQMVQGIRRVEESMGSNGERSISQGEMMNREVLARVSSPPVLSPPARRSPRRWWAFKARGKDCSPTVSMTSSARPCR